MLADCPVNRRAVQKHAPGRIGDPMKTTVEPLEGNKVKLSVEVDEREFDRALDAAFRKIANEVRIPGFRPGKAPRRLLEARLGAEAARAEALRDSLPTYYEQALKDHDVDAIAPPDIDITAGEESLLQLFGVEGGLVSLTGFDLATDVSEPGLVLGVVGPADCVQLEPQPSSNEVELLGA